MTELWGIYTASQIAWNESFSKVWIESDSLVAVGLSMKDCLASHRYAPILRAIDDLISRNWIFILLMLREGNRVADFFG